MFKEVYKESFLVGDGYQTKWSSLFHFFDDTYRFCSTPVKVFSMMVPLKISMQSFATRVSYCVTVVSVDVEAHMEYEDFEVVQCLPILLVGGCNVQLHWFQCLRRTNLPFTFVYMLFSAFPLCTVL